MPSTESTTTAGVATDVRQWERRILELSAKYQASTPFPHIILDNFLHPEVAAVAADAFPPSDTAGWINYMHYNEQKYGLNKFAFIPKPCAAVINALNSGEFIRLLENLTGISGLRGDETLEGGGLHQIARGGFLNIHADFTVHPHRKQWKRRVNLLVYLSKSWNVDYNGSLELWDRGMRRCEVSVPPLFNRCVIFNTDADSFHGVPDPVMCPPAESRKSIALYYYTEEARMPVKINTNYRARPHESLAKKLLVALDRNVLWLYSWLKSLTGIDDSVVSTILRFIGRNRNAS